MAGPPERFERPHGNARGDLRAAFDAARDDLLRENQVLQVSLPPRRIDVLTSISGVPFVG